MAHTWLTVFIFLDWRRKGTLKSRPLSSGPGYSTARHDTKKRQDAIKKRQLLEFSINHAALCDGINESLPSPQGTWCNGLDGLLSHNAICRELSSSLCGVSICSLVTCVTVGHARGRCCTHDFVSLFFGGGYKMQFLGVILRDQRMRQMGN